MSTLAFSPAPAAEVRTRKPSKRRLTSLWKRFKKSGDPALRNELVEAYLYLVKVISNRIAARLPRSIEFRPIRQMRNRKSSRCFEATSRMARFTDMT